MKHSLLVLLLSAICCHQVQGQQAAATVKLDSLQQVLKTMKEDTNKARLLSEITDMYISFAPEQAMFYSRTGLALAKKIGSRRYEADFYDAIGRVYADLSQFDSSIHYHQTALGIYKNISDKYNEGIVLNNIGSAAYRSSRYSTALEHYLEAMQIARKIRDKDMEILLLYNIALVYYDQRDYALSKKYAGEAYTLCLSMRNSRRTGMVLEGLSYMAVADDDKASAIKYNEEALTYYKTNNDAFGIAKVYSGLAVIYQDEIWKSLDYHLLARQIWDTLSPNFTTALSNLANLGTTLFDIAQEQDLYSGRPSSYTHFTQADFLRDAEAYIRKVVQAGKENDIKDIYATALKKLSMIQEYKGEYRASLANLRMAYEIEDSLYSQDVKNRIAALENQRTLELKDQQLELKNISLAAQRRQNVLLSVGAGLLCIVGGMVYRQSNIRKKNNKKLLRLNAQLDEANKTKAKFLGILSHDLRSPVASLLSFLQIQKGMKGDLDPEKALSYQIQIRTSAEVLQKNMEAMLLWSKSQMELFEADIRPVEAAHLFQYIKESFAPSSLAAPVDFRFANPGDVTVYTDGNFLKAIMHNLTGNAVQALKGTSGAYIRWSARKDKEQVLLQIEDNGPGVSETQLKELLEGGGPVHSKAGLGWHIIRDLSEVIGCHISYITTEGGGATFLIQFPPGKQ